jgi:hypothetical protein
MSEQPLDTNAETRSAIEALLPTAIAELKEQIDNGGVRSVRIRCTSCGANLTHEIQVADADLLVKAVTALSSALPRMASKDDARSARVTKILTDFSELTSAELAEYITNLEGLLDGQDSHSD